MRVTYMPGGVGAVAYNAVVAQRPADAGTLVAWSSGSLLNLAQGKFGRFDESATCAGWRPSAPATAPSR